MRNGYHQNLSAVLAAVALCCTAAQGQVFRGYSSDATGQITTEGGRRIRTVRGYYPDGSLHLVIEYRGDRISGTAREYYPGGKLKAEIEFRKNRRHGMSRFYYPNGMLMARAEYRRGRERAAPAFYDEKGFPLAHRLVPAADSASFPHPALSPAPEDTLFTLPPGTGP